MHSDVYSYDKSALKPHTIANGCPKRMPVYIFTQICNQNLLNCKPPANAFQCIPFQPICTQTAERGWQKLSRNIMICMGKSEQECKQTKMQTVKLNADRQKGAQRMQLHIFTQICRQNHSVAKSHPMTS